MRSRLVFLALALIALLVSAVLAARTALFVMGAERSIGTVTAIQSLNSSCSKSRRRGRVRSSYSCTKFQASVRYASAGGEVYSLSRSAGRARGHNQPSSLANLTAGQEVTVLYDSARPAEGRLDRFDDLWLGPSVAAFLGLIFGLCIIFPGRARYR